MCGTEIAYGGQVEAFMNDLVTQLCPGLPTCPEIKYTNHTSGVTSCPGVAFSCIGFAENAMHWHA